MTSIELFVRTSIQREVQQITCAIDEVGLKDNLWELGMDSISFIRLVVAIEIESEIEFEDDALSIDKFKTISDFINYITSRKSILL